MRKVYFYLPLKVVLLALLFGALAACGHDDLKKGTSEITTAVPVQYDLTLLADKDGTFDFDGATLTAAEDLRGHIRYPRTRPAGPVKTILLKPRREGKKSRTITSPRSRASPATSR